MGCGDAIYVDESTIDFPIFLLFFLFSNFPNPEFPIFLFFWASVQLHTLLLETIGRPGFPVLCIVGKMYKRPGWRRKAVRFELLIGKHVLVDYPLCLSAQGGKDLFNLAESKGMMEREVKKLTFY